MARVIISPEADADSAFIIGSLVAKAGAYAADRYEAEFDHVYQRLADFPESGAPQPRRGNACGDREELQRFGLDDCAA